MRSEEDSNLRESPRYLKVVRLPIPPRPRNLRSQRLSPRRGGELTERSGRLQARSASLCRNRKSGLDPYIVTAWAPGR